MTHSTLAFALKAGRGTWDKYRDFRDKQTVRAYDALVDAAASYDDLSEDLRDRGGQLAAAARRRLVKAQQELKASTKDFRHEAERAQQEAMAQARALSKVSQRTLAKAEKAGRRAAQRAQQRVNKKLARKQKKQPLSLWAALGLASAMATIAGTAAYWWQARQNEPVGTIPPRLGENAPSAIPYTSTLVYSTETGEEPSLSAEELDALIAEESPEASEQPKD